MTGEKTLHRMRLQGHRPEGFVVVTEDRAIARNARAKGFYALVFAPDEVSEWQVLHGLDVALVTRLPRAKLTAMCVSILNAEPLFFRATYFVDGESEHDVILGYATR